MTMSITLWIFPKGNLIITLSGGWMYFVQLQNLLFVAFPTSDLNYVSNEYLILYLIQTAAEKVLHAFERDVPKDATGTLKL